MLKASSLETLLSLSVSPSRLYTSFPFSASYLHLHPIVQLRQTSFRGVEVKFETLRNGNRCSIRFTISLSFASLSVTISTSRRSLCAPSEPFSFPSIFCSVLSLLCVLVLVSIMLQLPLSLLSRLFLLYIFRQDCSLFMFLLRASYRFFASLTLAFSADATDRSLVVISCFTCLFLQSIVVSLSLYCLKFKQIKKKKSFLSLA